MKDKKSQQSVWLKTILKSAPIFEQYRFLDPERQAKGSYTIAFLFHVN